MRATRGILSPITFLTIAALLGAVVLLVLQLVSFSRARAVFPGELTIAGIPVGGLDPQQTAQRLLEAYTLPVELRYGDSRIHLQPSVVEFRLDIDSMLAAANLARTEQAYWVDFWDYLWRREARPADVPLRASFSEQRLRTYLSNEIAQRYDQPPVPAMPAVGTVNFQPGQPGSTLDIDRSVALIESALRSTNNRRVDLPTQRALPARPSLQNLKILLQQTIDITEFDGLVSVYLLDLQTAQEIFFLYQNGTELPTTPDLSFTGSSIIKVPIMISAFKHMDAPHDPEAMEYLSLMIDKSGNEASDWLMDRVITTSQVPGPLAVTQDMRALGLQNTFLAGYFYTGAPLLQRFDTPGNTRADINTNPDLYNQTSLTEIGMLLAELYHCATQGGGSLLAVFPGELTQSECQLMIDTLARNRIGVLIEAGTPDGTRIAHKHGWTSDIFGTIRNIADAGIVYTPGGNYILAVYVYHPNELIFDPAAAMVADLSRAVYNYYNLPTP
jgi:beta-lactamase class A